MGCTDVDVHQVAGRAGFDSTTLITTLDAAAPITHLDEWWDPERVMG